jgi:hypothetical protein
MQTYQLTRITTEVAFVEAPTEEAARELAEQLTSFDYEVDDVDTLFELVAK